MVLPVTGPYQVSYARPMPGCTQNDEVWTRRRWRQAKPFTLPLPFSSGGAYRTSRSGTEATCAGAQAEQAALVDFPSAINIAKSVAYDRLLGQTKNTAQLSVSLIEARQSLSMIQQRALQLAAFTLAVKKGNLKQASKIIGTPQPRTGAIKSGAGQWLEFNLGWAPAIADIGNAVDVLQQPLKSHFVRASGTAKAASVWNNWPPNPWSSGTVRHYNRVACRYGIEVAIDNPNLYLANSLGFVNPASVIWEAVPFSFVVDYVFNIGQFLATGTDFLGLSVKNAFTSLHSDGTWSRRWGSPPGGESWFHWWKTTRETGISTPGLIVKPVWLTSWRRALTCVSLLTVQLKSLK